MTRPRGAAQLHLVRPGSQAVDELLAALDEWAWPAAPAGEPVAYLEAGDEQIRGDFPLPAAKVAELTELLRGAARRGGAG